MLVERVGLGKRPGFLHELSLALTVVDVHALELGARHVTVGAGGVARVVDPDHRVVGRLLAKQLLVRTDVGHVDVEGALAAGEDHNVPAWDEYAVGFAEDVLPLLVGPCNVPSLL
eukprot:2934949-Prymnesium_polylepis.1